MFSNSSSQDSVAVAHILGRINFKRFNEELQIAKWYPEQTKTIVLFEYVHSGMYDVIAEMERVPETTYFIHSALNNEDVHRVLKQLFVSGPTMRLFSRRKLDVETRQPTKYRQYVLQISPELPSPILNPEIASIFDLDDEV